MQPLKEAEEITTGGIHTAVKAGPRLVLRKPYSE